MALAVFLAAAFLSAGARMERRMEQKIEGERRWLAQLASSRALSRPELLLDPVRMRLSDLENNLSRAADLRVERTKEKIARAAAALEALSPLRVLTRGYAAVEKDGEVVASAGDLHPDDRLRIRFADGTVPAVVTGREP